MQVCNVVKCGWAWLKKEVPRSLGRECKTRWSYMLLTWPDQTVLHCCKAGFWIRFGKIPALVSRSKQQGKMRIPWVDFECSLMRMQGKKGSRPLTSRLCVTYISGKCSKNFVHQSFWQNSICKRCKLRPNISWMTVWSEFILFAIPLSILRNTCIKSKIQAKNVRTSVGIFRAFIVLSQSIQTDRPIAPNKKG